MFGKDKLIIAFVFVSAYTIFVVWSYWRDRKKTPAYFKGSLTILATILAVVLVLFILKLIIKS